MAFPNFPFWIVTQRRGLIAQPVEPDGMPGLVAALSSAENAARFMVRRGATKWENRLVSRSTFRDLMADLRRIGVQGLGLDPGEGGCQSRITFEAMEGT